MYDESPSSSPADKVGSNDDLLTEILLRLPVRSLLRFKSVSKHYYFLISTPRFKLLRNRKPDPPSGLVVPAHFNKIHMECEFVSFDIENPTKPPFKALDFAPNIERMDILDSCNGLMLCSSQGAGLMEDNMYRVYSKYYIYNPTINQFETIRSFDDCEISDQRGMTLAFDPSKSLHNKILYVYPFGMLVDGVIKTCYQIIIYSSDARSCVGSHTFSLDEGLGMDSWTGVYWENAVHWIHTTGFVLCFDLDQEITREIKTPFARLGLDHKFFISCMFVSRDHLLLVEIPHLFNSKFTVHELKRDYSGWFVKYRVDLEEVARSFPEIESVLLPHGIYKLVVMSIVLGEQEDDSFLVLEIPGKVVRFNLVSRTFYKLHDFTFPRCLNSAEVVRQQPHVFQFVESLYSL